jgi:histidinol-phosphatase
MASVSLADDLNLALELADVADAITSSRYRAADLLVETKPDMTPVTEADRAVEHALRERLGATRPQDSLVGEEFGASTTTDGGHRRWIIDPIDGTKNYVRGIPVWATLLALADGDEVVLGVVSAPALKRRWWAARGQGAFADGSRVHVSGLEDLADANLLWSSVEEWDEVGAFDAVLELARRCWRSRGLGDFWQYMLVAEGAAEIAVDPVVSLWDLAAPMVIVEEAGGRFSDLAGARTPDGGDAIASNGLVHDAALAIVGRRES